MKKYFSSEFVFLLLFFLLAAIFGVLFLGFSSVKSATSSKGLIAPIAAMAHCNPEITDFGGEYSFSRMTIEAQYIYERFFSTEKVSSNGEPLIPLLFEAFSYYKGCNEDLLRMAKKYLNRGADVNAENSGHKTALTYVLYSGQVGGLNFLLENNADICKDFSWFSGVHLSPLGFLEKLKANDPKKYTAIYVQFSEEYSKRCSQHFNGITKH